MLSRRAKGKCQFPQEEKKLVAEIKKTAKTRNEGTTRILAHQLVRLRQQITNLQGSRAQIRGVATHTQAMYASNSISAGIKGASKAMASMNKEMEPTEQTKIMMEFQKQSMQMDLTGICPVPDRAREKRYRHYPLCRRADHEFPAALDKSVHKLRSL